MESTTLTLDDLTHLFDDVEPQEHDDTPGNTGVPQLAPPPSGKYGIRLASIDVDKDMNGQVRDKLNFSCDVTVIDPPAGAEFMQDKKVRFIRVTGRSRQRKDSKTGQLVKYVELFDLCRGFQRDFDPHHSIQAALTFLIEQIQTNGTASVQLDWKAWDLKHWEAHNGDMLAPGSDEIKQLRRECSFQGQRRFEKDGTMINAASGNLLKARVYLKFVYPSAV